MKTTKDMHLWDEVTKTVTPIEKARARRPFEKLFFFLKPKTQLSPKLDLHGKTVQAAFDDFGDFIAAHKKLGTKRICIVTGKGIKGEGILKKEFPMWLDRPDIKSKISKVEVPPPNNEGALFIYLKRDKK